MSASEYRYIVRIAGKDVDGSRKIAVAISEIRGVGLNFASALLNALKIDPSMRVGFISDKEISEIENGIRDPLKAGLPVWYLNRCKDIETGADTHLVGSDWDIMLRNDIEREKQAMSWRGVRHMFGLKVRGQRTRTTGRKGGAVGVRKGGKVMPTVAPGVAAPTEEQPAAAEAKEGKPEVKKEGKPEAKESKPAPGAAPPPEEQKKA